MDGWFCKSICCHRSQSSCWNVISGAITPRSTEHAEGAWWSVVETSSRTCLRPQQARCQGPDRWCSGLGAQLLCTCNDTMCRWGLCSVRGMEFACCQSLRRTFRRRWPCKTCATAAQQVSTASRFQLLVPGVLLAAVYEDVAGVAHQSHHELLY